MDDRGQKTYRPWDPSRYRQQAHSPDSKLPEGDLVFFLLDTMPQLDLAPFYSYYESETRGAPPFDPAMMVCLLLYSYCVGVYSSRKIAQACERNLAFMAIVGEDRPDFRTISDFRKIHLEAFADVFVQVLRLAGAAGLVRLGNIAMDGTKIQGNASRHKAMSYGYMKKEEERLQAEIKALLAEAQKKDGEEDGTLGSRRGDELPEELQRRELRLAKILEAKARLEAAARAAAEEERHRRQEEEAERQRTGQQRRGREPGPIQETPDDKAQTNFTDPELKIMKTNNKGWDYCGNAQASVDSASQIIIACDVSDAANDKQQAVPLAKATLTNLEAADIPLPSAAGQEAKIPAMLDSGYYSETAAQEMEDMGFDPFMATGRQKHHEQEAPGSQPAVEGPTVSVPVGPAVAVPVGETASVPEEQAASVPVGDTASMPEEQVAPMPEGNAASMPEGQVAPMPEGNAASIPEGSTPVPKEPVAGSTNPVTAGEKVANPTQSASPKEPTAKEKMAAKLKTPRGKELYARRKVIVEPVFGQIKGARGFRRFLLRGLKKVRGEWRLVCLTHNLLKIWRYRCAPSGV